MKNLKKQEADKIRPSYVDPSNNWIKSDDIAPKRGAVTLEIEAEAEPSTTPYVPDEVEADEINALHNLLVSDATEFASDSVAKGVKIGEKLRSKKKTMRHGEWGAWVKKWLKFDIRTASRYMALANPKKTRVSDLKACTSLMAAYVSAGIDPKKSPTTRKVTQLFSPGAEQLLSHPEKRSPEDKITILRDYERLEPIATQLQPRSSIFSLGWQKKMQEPPAHLSRREVALLKEDVARAQAYLAEVEKDSAEFDVAPAAQDELEIIEGDAK